ncbi:MAG: HPr(Ser) kinase/phosphatase [Tissierellia bacterium]|nr:HPr(Ser) kinase/phosphatase [Tissierellia bacterium]
MDYFLLDDLLDEFKFEVLYVSENHSDIKIYTSETNRPGLQLVGHYKKFEPKRIQIIGNAEWEYLNDLSSKARSEKMNEFLSYNIPILVFTNGNWIFDEVIEVAKKHNTTLVRTEHKTATFLNRLINYIDTKLSPKTHVHGVLVNVNDIGVLITGQSGVGKSETALDLVIRGHKLISDDIVEIIKLDDYLSGTSPEITRHFMEIRGIGIIDIEKLYGIASIKKTNRVDLVIELENWDEQKEYDRTGFEEETISILDIMLPKITIPVKPGRNTAMIVEVASRNHKQKSLGESAIDSLTNRMNKMRKK